MKGITSAEATKHRQTPKVLHHLELHPMMGGGVRVEHHHSSYEHPMEPHEFHEGEGASFHKHIAKHTGMEHENLEEQGGSEPEPFE